MAKTRRDSNGRALQRGELYRANRKLYSYSYMDAMGVRRYIYSKDLMRLRDKEKELHRDALDGIDSYARATCTVNFLFERYLSTKTNLRSMTRTHYTYNYRKYIEPTIGKRKIGEIKYSDVRYFYQNHLDNGLGVATLEEIHILLYSIFKMAVRDDVVRKNPTIGVLSEVKGKGRTATKRHALSREEQRAFLEYLEEPKYERWRPLFIFLFGTGCRIGEVIGLRWEDIDFENNEIDINHDITYGMRDRNGFKACFEVGPPKTEAGKRRIPMFEKVRKALEDEKMLQDKYGFHNTAVVDGMSGFIFTTRYNGLQTPGNINKTIDRIVDDYNAREELEAAREGRRPVIIPRFSCHITRHTFCTRLCESGTNIKLIQQIMGHVDIRTTMDIYAEVTRDRAQTAFQEMNQEDVL